MTRNERIEAWSFVGRELQKTTDTLDHTIRRAKAENPWFTEENVRKSLAAISDQFLDAGKLERWLDQYAEPSEPKTIALVLAGNIPLVGFHDVLCASLMGHHVQLKLSSKDGVLLPAVLSILFEAYPQMAEEIKVVERVQDFDAVIATGSDNSHRYFDYYFGKYPNLLRKNRTSVAVLTGDEHDEELTALGGDIFDYFGLGCRNVSRLFVPKGYDVPGLFDHWTAHLELGQHNRFKNNHDYQSAVLLLNKEPHFSNGVLILRESEALLSPIAMVHYSFYEDTSKVEAYIRAHDEDIQCVVTNRTEIRYPRQVAFGCAQQPQLNDYADGVDTLAFLSEL